MRKFLIWLCLLTAVATSAQPGATSSAYVNPSMETTENIYYSLLLDIPTARHLDLKSDQNADEKQPDCFLPPFTVEPVTFIASGQVADFYHSQLKVPYAWAKTRGANVALFGLDTGQPNHPDLPTAGYQFAGNATPEPIIDGHSHGSMVGGMMCAIDNDFGTVGVAPDGLYIPLKGMRNNGSGYSNEIAAMIRYAADVNLGPYNNYIRVLNMSFGSSSPIPEIEQALNYAESKGVILVASAGNNGCTDPNGNTMGWPARYKNVISIGSIDKQDISSWFSSCGADLIATGYGQQVYLPNNQNGYVITNGTSFSGPQVAAMIALYASAHIDKFIAAGPNRNKLAMEAVKKYATDIGAAGKDNKTGYGKVLGTIVDSPVPGLPGDPPPNPVGPVRTIGVSTSDLQFTMYWRPNNSANLTQSKIVIELTDYKTTDRGWLPASMLRSALTSFWTNRAFILLDNDDEWEALYWARHFTELILKPMGYDIRIQSMRISNAQNTYTLRGDQRRSNTQVKAASEAMKAGKASTYILE